MAATFLWYDLETFGRDPRWDRIAQFAAIRTDSDLNPIDEPTILYGRISPDYVPDPEACLITGLTPRQTGAKGLVEADLASEIHAVMTNPGTCAVGFNSLKFDDEFIRNLFYRNFYDPYWREYAHGNSKWDILPLVRLAHDLRPEGIQWVYDSDGKPVFRLEELTQANRLEHQHAHDALSDVEATILIADLVRKQQPRLYNYYLSLRKKDAVRRTLNLQNPTPVLYSASIFTRPGATTSVVFPLTVHPGNENEIIAFDLRHEPERLWSLEPEELRRLVFTSQEELGEEQRVPLTGIRVNKIPAIAPLNTIDTERAQSLGLDVPAIQDRAGRLTDRLHDDPGFAARIREVFQSAAAPVYQDPDLNIYSGGFFGDEDKPIFDWIHCTPPNELAEHPPEFADPRGAEMFRRFLGRNWPDVFSQEESRRWKSYCAGRLLAPEYERALDFGRFRKKTMNLMNRRDVPPRDKSVLRDLLDYADWLEKNILSQA